MAMPLSNKTQTAKRGSLIILDTEDRLGAATLMTNAETRNE